MIQLLAAKHLTGKVDEESILLPPPSREDASGEILLGTLVYREKRLYPVYLRRENFQKHIGIYSITGGGKTNVSQNILLQLLEKKIPFLVVDWKRSYRDLYTLKRTAVKKIETYTVGRKTASPFSWNPLRGPPGIHPKTWISVIAEILEKSHISGQGVADIFTEILDRKFEALGVYTGRYIHYDGIASEKNRSHCPYRIFLRQKGD